MAHQYKFPNAALLLLSVLASNFAAAAGTDPADPCKSQSNTLELNECAARTLEARDKALNLAYQNLLKKLVPDDQYDKTDYATTRKYLIEAQKNWIRYRDADCSGQYVLYAEGSIRNIVALNCQIEKTEQRTKELNHWVMGD